MSLDFNWDALREPLLLESLRTLINEKLSSTLKDKFIQNLTLNELSFGASPPEVHLEDLQDPHPEFLLGHANPFGLPEENSVQLVVRVKYEGSLTAIFHGELAINYPAPQFVTLPIKITIKELLLNGILSSPLRVAHQVFLGKLYVVKVGDKVMVSLRKEPETKVSFVFDSEIGDPTRHSLKNVGRVETFIQSLVHKVIEMLLVFPNYLQVRI